MTYDKGRFQKFIYDEYIKFRGDSEASWSDFAKKIGVSQQTMASWKNGYLKKPPDQENIAKLIRALGTSVYEALGLQTPPTTGLVMSHDQGNLTDDEMNRIIFDAKELVKKIEDPYDRIVFYEEYLKSHGVQWTYFSMGVPLYSIDNPEAHDLLELFYQMTVEEREEFLDAGRKRIESKRSSQPKRKTRASQNPV